MNVQKNVAILGALLFVVAIAAFVVLGPLMSRAQTESSTASSTLVGTVATSTDLSTLITSLQGLQSVYPLYSPRIQLLINDLYLTSGTSSPGMGTLTGTVASSTGSTNGMTIDQDGWTFPTGFLLDFGGHNFGREQDVTVSMGGVVVGHAHSDGGGNFSTGWIPAPMTPGTYTYTFTETNGAATSAWIHVI